MIPYSTAFFLAHYQIALYIAAAISFLFAILLLVGGYQNSVTRLYAAFTISIAYWALTQALIGTWTPSSSWFVITKVEHFGHVFIPTLFLHLVHTLTGRHQPVRLALSYCMSFGFFCLVPTRWFVAGIDESAIAKYVVEPGPLYPLYLAWFIGTIVEALAKVRVSVTRSEHGKRRELRYVFWAATIGFLGGLPNFFYVFDVDVYPINPFSTYLVSTYVAFIAYIILIRGGILNITIAIRKSLIYSILVTILTVSYFGLVYAVERLFQLTFGYQSVWVSLGAFAMMALAFQPLKIGIQRLVDWSLFKAPREELERRVERLEQEAQQTEKLKAVATLAAGMAHEIKNPLSSIKIFADYLPQKYDEPEFRDKFSRIVGQEVGKINELVQRLLDFARPRTPEKQSVKLSKLVDETVEFLHGALVNKHIEVVRAYSKQDEIVADPTQLKQAFLNIFLNSIQAMDRPGCITISTASENSHLNVVIADTGTGISKEHFPHVFDPFYTTRPAGTGLGLSVVHSIVREHGGRVAMDSAPGRGTTVQIQLPIKGG